MDQTIPFGNAQLVTSRTALVSTTNEQVRELNTLHLWNCRSLTLLVFSGSVNEVVNF
jgi:hypothetical protein